MKKQKILFLVTGIVFAFLFASAGAGFADETSLFVSATQPDALIVLDLSGSMAWNPPGDDAVYGSSDACYPDYLNCGCADCTGGYCNSSKSARTCYASNACGTPDTTDCTGTGCSNGYCSSAQTIVTFYAASSCTTPNYANCRGTACGRTDGYCNAAQGAGAVTYYAHSSSCTADTTNCKYSETTKDCANGFCASSHTKCTYACSSGACNKTCTTGHDCAIACSAGSCSSNCSRLNIAKRSVFNILDDNNDGTINTTDEGTLAVRLGYMRFYNCSSDESSVSYTSGCNTLVKSIGSTYSSINTSVQAESASGGTPIASALREAKAYLDDNKAADASKNCRQKFVILITDGSDTYACSASGSECDDSRYKNRRAVVARAKALADAGYRTFVIGFGSSMPPYLINTLNWMAYYGGTDNPNQANSGNVTAYNVPTGCQNTIPVTSACCSDSNLSACYPSGVSSCQADSSTMTATCYDSGNPYCADSAVCPGNSTDNYRATNNDPGYMNLSGYAFIASDADQLVAAVKAAINIIREATYSFSQASIQSSRTTIENFVFEGSFQPVNGDPFWLGHLRKFQINSDGSVGDEQGDAGAVLQTTAYTARTMYTCIGCAASYTTGITPPAFSNSISPSYFGVTTATAVNAIVGYIQGNPTYNPDNWKLGDVFRSTPITLGTPSSFFKDYRYLDAYNAYQSGSNVQRTSDNGKRLIVAGANDGQFHAFRTGNLTEAWSFIPPNLLSKLQNIAHATEPTALVHQYYVDGPVSAADAWLGTGSGTSKLSTEWKTVLIFGEGRGSADRLWSSATDCASGLAGSYTSTYANYCGYYAFDVTDTVNPKFKWRLNTFNGSTEAPYMGDSWSKMTVGRVLTKSGSTETEKWLGFIGGGYNANNCVSGTCDTKGKGIFMVDLIDGHIYKSYTRSATTGMDYAFPAPPALADTDSDGMIDRAYIGDMGGNIWRIKFCTRTALNQGGGCTDAGWSISKLFSSAGAVRPIYTSAAVVMDELGNIWVTWGTGDKVDPTSTASTDYFYAVKDDGSTTLTTSNIATISTPSGVFNPTSTTLSGYRIQMPGTGEKILADPAIYGGVVYFTSFTPGSSTDPCLQSGTSTLYGIYCTTGAAAIDNDNNPNTPTVRSVNVGTGIASAPIVSLAPSDTGAYANIYVTVSGGGLTSASTLRMNFNPQGTLNRTNVMFWRDTRIQ